jgi:hypothetical protein
MATHSVEDGHMLFRLALTAILLHSEPTLSQPRLSQAGSDIAKLMSRRPSKRRRILLPLYGAELEQPFLS